VQTAQQRGKYMREISFSPIGLAFRIPILRDSLQQCLDRGGGRDLGRGLASFGLPTNCIGLPPAVRLHNPDQVFYFDSQGLQRPSTSNSSVFLDNPFFTVLAARSIRETGRLALPFGTGRTSPVAASDVADVVTTVLRSSDGHPGAVYELTGPAALDVDELAEQYAAALDRPVPHLSNTTPSSLPTSARSSAMTRRTKRHRTPPSGSDPTATADLLNTPTDALPDECDMSMHPRRDKRVIGEHRATAHPTSTPTRRVTALRLVAANGALRVAVCQAAGGSQALIRSCPTSSSTNRCRCTTTVLTPES
jgi:hypothetical protein